MPWFSAQRLENVERLSGVLVRSAVCRPCVDISDERRDSRGREHSRFPALPSMLVAWLGWISLTRHEHSAISRVGWGERRHRPLAGAPRWAAWLLTPACSPRRSILSPRRVIVDRGEGGERYALAEVGLRDPCAEHAQRRAPVVATCHRLNAHRAFGSPPLCLRPAQRRGTGQS